MLSLRQRIDELKRAEIARRSEVEATLLRKTETARERRDAAKQALDAHEVALAEIVARPLEDGPDDDVAIDERVNAQTRARVRRDIRLKALEQAEAALVAAEAEKSADEAEGAAAHSGGLERLELVIDGFQTLFPTRAQALFDIAASVVALDPSAAAKLGAATLRVEMVDGAGAKFWSAHHRAEPDVADDKGSDRAALARAALDRAAAARDSIAAALERAETDLRGARAAQAGALQRGAKPDDLVKTVANRLTIEEVIRCQTKALARADRDVGKARGRVAAIEEEAQVAAQQLAEAAESERREIAAKKARADYIDSARAIVGVMASNYRIVQACEWASSSYYTRDAYLPARGPLCDRDFLAKLWLPGLFGDDNYSVAFWHPQTDVAHLAKMPLSEIVPIDDVLREIAAGDGSKIKDVERRLFEVYLKYGKAISETGARCVLPFV